MVVLSHITTMTTTNNIDTPAFCNAAFLINVFVCLLIRSFILVGPKKWGQVLATAARDRRFEDYAKQHHGKLPKDNCPVMVTNLICGKCCRCCRSHRQVYMEKKLFIREKRRLSLGLSKEELADLERQKREASAGGSKKKGGGGGGDGEKKKKKSVADAKGGGGGGGGGGGSGAKKKKKSVSVANSGRPKEG